MAKPPDNNERRYQGQTRANIALAREAITRLQRQNDTYVANGGATYPSQLATVPDIAKLDAAAALFDTWLAARGPIPNPVMAAAASTGQVPIAAQPATGR